MFLLCSQRTETKVNKYPSQRERETEAFQSQMTDHDTKKRRIIVIFRCQTICVYVGKCISEGRMKKNQSNENKNLLFKVVR